MEEGERGEMALTCFWILLGELQFYVHQRLLFMFCPDSPGFKGVLSGFS